MRNILKLLPLLIFGFTSIGGAQTNLNHYKYFSVADRFDFLKEDDQYQVNSLTKFLLQKNGFIVLSPSDEFPEDLAQNRCLLATVEVVKIQAFLKTKLEVQFKDCYNKIIHKSAIGLSREKDYQKAYNEALREAFKSISEITYSYNKAKPKADTKAPKTSVAVVNTNEENTNLDTELESEISTPPSIPDVEPSSPTNLPLLMIVQTSFGYNVVESSTGNVAFSLHATMYDGMYIISNLPGIAYKRGDRWVREYISNNKTIIEPLY